MNLDLTRASLDAAAPTLGDGPVTMVNLIRLRPTVAYDVIVDDAKQDPRSALFDGYSAGFSRLAEQLGVSGVEPVLIGKRVVSLQGIEDDDWDLVIAVRYRSFDDFRKIVESETYRTRVRPHHRAAVADWSIIATAA